MEIWLNLLTNHFVVFHMGLI